MMFRAAPLTDRDLPRGLALVQFFNADVDLAALQDFLCTARNANGRDFTAVLIEDRRGYAHALLAMRRDVDLQHGVVLRVTALACSGMPSPALHAAILAAAEARAREIGCGGLVMELGDNETAHRPLTFEASVRDSGFTRVGSAYYRALPRL